MVGPGGQREQAVVATQPMTRAGLVMVAQLRQVHQLLRDDIATLESTLAALRDAAADPEQARELLGDLNIARNAWSLRTHCEYYCDLLTGHHSLEDSRMFPVLLREFPELEPVLRRLGEEHHQVDALIARVRLKAALLDGTPGTAADARAVIGELAQHLRAHLAYEEESLNPYLGRLERDWHHE